MKTIWKFPLALQGLQLLTMPRQAKILTVQLQNNRPCLWAVVDPTAASERRVFHIVGTEDESFDETDTHYLGTVQQNLFVWHVFEAIGKKEQQL